MPGSIASVFSEAEDFETALGQEGCLGLLVTGRGSFRARLTQIALHRLRLSDVEEQLTRIAFVSVPAGILLVLSTAGNAPSPVWAGIEIGPNEIITIQPDERLHTRTDGPAIWSMLRMRERDLLEIGRAVAGPDFIIPGGVARWQSSSAVIKELRDLCRAAIRTTRTRPFSMADVEATHALEQQIIGTLIECLSTIAEEETPTARRHRDMLARFDDLLHDGSGRSLSDISAALGISDRLLRECCKIHLGMTPVDYRRRQAMQRVYRELRGGNIETATVSEIARRHGFTSLGRFAAEYHMIYGEIPSATLRSSYGVPPISFGGRRVRREVE
ncbi:MAG: helix-turn-helix transcriptional regulator [Alphaproteobacteria bacterium]|nr:helix-turn-helix transcriptional regulator [Alphaproteobacteria bacterium]